VLSPCSIRSLRPVLRRAAPRVCAVLSCSLLLVACGGRESGSGRGVLLIAVDALRADHLSSFGYDRTTSPNLDRLVAEGVRFEQTFSAAPQLVPAHAALLTGCDPNLARRWVPQWRQASFDPDFGLSPEVPRLAVELAVAGYRTAAFGDHPEFSPVFGFDDGFQTFEALWQDDESAEDPGAARASFRLRQWLRGLASEDDWFAYLHLNDLERVWRETETLRDTYFEPRPELAAIPPVGASDPCLFAIPPSRWLGGSFTLGQYEARYDGALLRLDQELGRLFEALERSGHLARTTVCVVGTFGLQFGEAGLVLDHGRLSAVDLSVPWILRPATGVPFAAGRRVEALASLLDVAPTLLALEGVAVPRSMLGVNQAAQLATPGPPLRSFAFASCGIQGGYSAFGDRWALEVTFPSQAAPPLVEGWYGRPDVADGAPFDLAYCYREESTPALSSPGRNPPEVLELRAAAAAWIDRVEHLRAGLQRPPGPFGLDEEPGP
jgi:arylsulfatase A-like enzyme